MPRPESPRRFASFFGVLFSIVIATMVPAPATPLCTISNATPLIFDTSYDGERPDDGRTSFVITCAHTQTTSISLQYSHRMTGGKKRTELHYDLYATANHSSIWGSGGDGASIPITLFGGRPVTVYMYARIPAHQQLISERFSDTVEIVTAP